MQGDQYKNLRLNNHRTYCRVVIIISIIISPTPLGSYTALTYASPCQTGSHGKPNGSTTNDQDPNCG